MAQYRIGLVSTTAASNVITAIPDNLGNAPEWLTYLSPGDSIVVGNDTVAYTVSSIIDDDELQLTSNYPTTQTNVPYFAFIDFTSALGIPLIARGDLDWTVQYNESMRMLDEIVGQIVGLEIFPQLQVDDLIVHNRIVYRNAGSGAFEAQVVMPTFTADRTITLPDASGTVLVSSVPLGTLAFQNASAISVSLVADGTSRNLTGWGLISGKSHRGELTTSAGTEPQFQFGTGAAGLARREFTSVPGLGSGDYTIWQEGSSGGNLGIILASTQLVCTGANLNLGNSSNRWGTIFAAAVNTSGNSTLGDASTDAQTLNGLISFPHAISEANAFAIGAAAKLWESASGVLRTGIFESRDSVVVISSGSGDVELTNADSGKYYRVTASRDVKLPTSPVSGVRFTLSVASSVDAGGNTIIGFNAGDPTAEISLVIPDSSINSVMTIIWNGSNWQTVALVGSFSSV